MTPDQPEFRIGDAERDDAIALLQDHLSAGRLDNEEFDARIGRALQARTNSDLEPLFTDLPGRRPGQSLEPAAPQYATGAYQVGEPAAEQEPQPQSTTRPWYAQWWIIPLVIVLASANRVSLAVLMPLVCVWVFYAWPRMARSRTPQQPVRSLSLIERRELSAMVRQGQRVPAIKRHRELTGSDLRTAKTAIDQLERHPEL